MKYTIPLSIELNHKKTYEVIIRRTQTMRVYVEAHTEKDALDTVNGKYDNGEYGDDKFEDVEAEAISPIL